jgi:hypothetical protein
MKGSAAVAGQRRHRRGRVLPLRGQREPYERPIAPSLLRLLLRGVPPVPRACDGRLTRARHQGGSRVQSP